jgi:hypothetical protein
MLSAVLFIFAKLMLRTLIGNDSMDPAFFAAAVKYVRIRALGMPTAAVIGPDVWLTGHKKSALCYCDCRMGLLSVGSLACMWEALIP